MPHIPRSPSAPPVPGQEQAEPQQRPAVRGEERKPRRLQLRPRRLNMAEYEPDFGLVLKSLFGQDTEVKVDDHTGAVVHPQPAGGGAGHGPGQAGPHQPQ